MQTLIAYMSRHGCAKKSAKALRQRLPGIVDLHNIKSISQPNLAMYDLIIIGGSIHAGKIQNQVCHFCEDHLEMLLHKKLALFLCCMETGEKAEEQLRNAFPEVLRQHAMTVDIFGGEFDFSKMNFIEKYFVRKIARVNKNVSTLSSKKIDDFARKLTAELFFTD